MIRKTKMSNILTPDQIQTADTAEPHQILMAVHKRLVNAESLISQYKAVVNDLAIQVEMFRDKNKELTEDVAKIYKELNELKEEKS